MEQCYAIYRERRRWWGPLPFVIGCVVESILYHLRSRLVLLCTDSLAYTEEASIWWSLFLFFRWIWPGFWPKRDIQYTSSSMKQGVNQVLKGLLCSFCITKFSVSMSLSILYMSLFGKEYNGESSIGSITLLFYPGRLAKLLWQRDLAPRRWPKAMAYYRKSS